MLQPGSKLGTQPNLNTPAQVSLAHRLCKKFSAILSSLAQFATSEYNVTEIVIRPVSLTTRGAIGVGRVCPINEVAIGFRLKMENHVGTPWTEGVYNPENT